MLCPSRGKRDPEARKRAIVEAAAELVVDKGASRLTHRAVAARAKVALGSTTQYFSSIDELREAALRLIAARIDADIARIEELVRSTDDALEQAASILHDFLLDTTKVRAEVALLNAGTDDPSLRELARRWSVRLVDILAPRLGEESATAIAVFVDGTTIHAGLNDEPLSRQALVNALRALAGQGGTR